MKTISLSNGLVALWYPFIFGFYLFCTPALARTLPFFASQKQEIQVTGIVTDGTLPLSRVSISVKNQKNTAITDFDGKFSITVSPSANLIFTYIGFKTVEIPVAGRLVINVKMQQDATTRNQNVAHFSFLVGLVRLGLRKSRRKKKA